MTRPPKIAGIHPATLRDAGKKSAKSLSATAGNNQKPKIQRGINISNANPNEPMVSMAEIVIASKSTSHNIIPKKKANISAATKLP